MARGPAVTLLLLLAAIVVAILLAGRAEGRLILAYALGGLLALIMFALLWRLAHHV